MAVFLPVQPFLLSSCHASVPLCETPPKTNRPQTKTFPVMSVHCSHSTNVDVFWPSASSRSMGARILSRSNHAMVQIRQDEDPSVGERLLIMGGDVEVELGNPQQGSIPRRTEIYSSTDIFHVGSRPSPLLHGPINHTTTTTTTRNNSGGIGHEPYQYSVSVVEYKTRRARLQNRMLPHNEGLRSRYESVTGADGMVYVLETHSCKLSIFDPQNEEFTGAPVLITARNPGSPGGICHLYRDKDEKVHAFSLFLSGTPIFFPRTLAASYIGCEVFNVSENRHEEHTLRTVQRPSEDDHPAKVTLRVGTSVTYLKWSNRLIMYGGMVSELGDDPDNLVAINLNNMTMENLWIDTESGAHSPAPRRGCVIRPTRDERMIIVYGGVEEMSGTSLEDARLLEVFNDVWIFCLNNRSWLRIDPWIAHPELAPLPRAYAACVDIEPDCRRLGIQHMLISGGICSTGMGQKFDHDNRFFSRMLIMSPDVIQAVERFRSFAKSQCGAFSDVDIVTQR